MGPILRILAVTAASIIALSFALFTVDQLSEGSEDQVRSVRGDANRLRVSSLIDQPDPPPRIERLREKENSSVREGLDDGNDVLLSPFAHLLDSNDVWVRRMVPGVIGLLLYGLVGMLLANMLGGKKHEVRDWREAPG